MKDEVTMSGTINITIKDAEYERVLDKEMKMVYQLYPVAVKESFTIIPNQIFYTPEFRANRTIQFPECVLGIGQFYEMKRRYGLFGINDGDFSWNKAFMADWLGGGIMMSADLIMGRTISMSLWDQLRQFILVDINHKWNESNNTLLVTGRDPYYNVFCGLHVTAPQNELYDDAWVRQWVAAKCKLQVAKTIGTFTTNLLGGVTVNTALYTEEANKEIEECKEQWKMQRDADQRFYTTP